MRTHLIVAITALAAACTSVKPIAVHSGDVCYRCRRTIVEPKLAAEIVDLSSRAFKFRSAGCLAQYLGEHREELRGVFVTDYKSGKLIQAGHASFVPAEIDRQTGERDYLAFANAADAAAGAATNHSSPIAWPDVLARARPATN